MSANPTEKKTVPGINIQWPWTQLLLSGRKTIETRSYPIPKKYLNVPMAIIETPGPGGRQQGKLTSKVVGLITFCDCFKYENKREWLSDQPKHCVDESDEKYSFGSSSDRWGWVVSKIERLVTPIDPPARRGIIFATECQLNSAELI